MEMIGAGMVETLSSRLGRPKGGPVEELGRGKLNFRRLGVAWRNGTRPVDLMKTQ